MAATKLGMPSGVALPPSPPYSPKRQTAPPSPAIPAHASENAQPPSASRVRSTGLETPSRSPSSSSSFGDSSALIDHSTNHESGGDQRNQVPTPESDRSNSQVDGVRKEKPRKVKLEDFELIRVLGKGCAGRVLLVKQTRTNTIHAMKAISKRSVFAHDELAHTLAELSILKRFAADEPDNMFVSKLHHSFTDQENLYFVLEFYPGGDLATQMEIHGVLGDHRTRFYAADITQGLEDLHRNGIIVRDLKPENILLNSRGHCVLADFGLSKEFSYRGDPHPVHVSTYPGQAALPVWAGGGAGSMRTLPGGSTRLIVDKAYSFVGTSEYLSPEVVKRGEYSYAVDWWALGCIVLEGLVGRVPFRKREDEPPIVLWEKILADPWDELFSEPRMRPHALDPVTYSFLDALLQKDPMWRLTEPYVKTHEYFSMLDWETVKRGEYQDPHGLHLHPVAEYNTRYFPKLCLEEDPSVDMSTHDIRDLDDFKRTPLNDNQLYAIEQAKHWMELQSFAWSPPEVEEEEMEEERSSVPSVKEEPDEDNISLEESGANISDVDQSFEVPEVVLEDQSEGEGYGEREVSLRSEADLVADVDEELNLDKDESPATEPMHRRSEGESIPEMPSPLPEPLDQEETKHTPLARAASLHESSMGSLLAKTPMADHPLLPAEKGHEPSSPEATAQHIGLPPLPPSPRAQARPVPFSGLPKPKAVTDLVLPAGLPAGGLSVSDLMSIPSPGLGSPTRIVRRHPQRPSVDTIPIARLSVELHGTITQIEDEEWEELTLEGPDASAPNGMGPHHPSFFSRGLGGVLRRKPSTLVTSGLRRQTKNSDSSRDSSSPTKSITRPTLFSGKSTRMETTKKALTLGILKTFPNPKHRLAKKSQHSTPGVTPTRTPTPVLSPTILSDDQQGRQQMQVPARPNPARRHTESGWFERRKKGKLTNSASASASASATSESPSTAAKARAGAGAEAASIADSGGRVSVTSSSHSSGGAPRLELNDLGRVVWEFDGAEWGMK